MPTNTTKIKVPDELYLTGFNIGGRESTIDPPILVRKGTVAVELVNDSKPFKIEFRKWDYE